MKNKKGFTLIELLATITIMTVIATITTVNIIKIYDNNESAQTKTKENIITTAACVYIELEKNKALKETCLDHGCQISTTTLIKAGLLNEEDVDKEKVINIYEENNEKKCTIE